MSQPNNKVEDDAKKDSKLETIAKYAPAASAFITATFVVLTGINIYHQVSQKKIENAFLIREKLTPKLSISSPADPYTPDLESKNIVGIRVKIKNELPAITHFQSSGVQIYTCDGEPLNLQVITQKGTSGEAVVTPSNSANGGGGFGGQIAPLSDDIITYYLWGVSGYSREQLALVEEKQTIFALMYLDFWVEGVNNFREFIFEHSKLLMEDAPKSIDDFSKKPFSLTMNFPLVFEIGDRIPRAISPSYCREGIVTARGKR